MSRRYWPALAWAVTVFEAQDEQWEFLRLHLSTHQNNIRARSSDSPFLLATYRRWYPNGKLTFPIGLDFTPEVLTFWLVRAVIEAKDTLPVLSFAEMGPDDTLRAAQALERLAGPSPLDWLATRVPRAIWSA